MNEEISVVSFDYELPHKCQYPVTTPFYGGEMWEEDCKEPAPYRGYWVDDDLNETSEIWLCKEHLDYILKCEKKYS